MDGSGADEHFAVSPIGGRTSVTRDVSDLRMDLHGVDRLDINAAGGADTLRVDDLSGTDTEEVAFELAPFRGTTATDLAHDSVVVGGSNGNDAIGVTAAGHPLRVAGLATTTVVNRSDRTLDTLHVDTRLGNDLVSVEPAVHALFGFSTS
jgi:hypothetical protein